MKWTESRTYRLAQLNSNTQTNKGTINDIYILVRTFIPSNFLGVDSERSSQPDRRNHKTQIPETAVAGINTVKDEILCAKIKKNTDGIWKKIMQKI